ncbi:MAG: hypothetical protein U0Q11_24395 [Vicinamibacterales bacterium]
MLKKLATVAGAVAMSWGMLAASVEASTHNDRALFRFSAPVSIPGGTLPAGDYIFRLADPDSGRSVVQVVGVDGTVHGMFFTQRTERALPAEMPELSLGEAPAGEVRSISSWWQPGDVSGREFMYRPGEASWERSGSDAAID